MTDVERGSPVINSYAGLLIGDYFTSGAAQSKPAHRIILSAAAAILRHSQDPFLLRCTTIPMPVSGHIGTILIRQDRGLLPGFTLNAVDTLTLRPGSILNRGIPEYFRINCKRDAQLALGDRHFHRSPGSLCKTATFIASRSSI